MGFYYPVNLDNHSNKRTIFRCSYCYCHLFTSNNIISENFKGRNGKGLLVNRVVNFKPSTIEKRQMMTGDYSVADAHCLQCGHYLGWKYVKAWESSEKYKEGSFVIEIPQLHSS